MSSSSHATASHVQHHFADSEQQFDSAVFGTWIFLVTEIMFFGGAFMAYIGQGAFGANEAPVGANNATGWPADPWAVPVYNPGTFGTPRTVVSINRFADDDDAYYESYNRLGGRRYLRVDLPAAGGLRVTAQGPAGSDPDFTLYRKGVDQCPNGGACSGLDDSVGTGLEEATFSGLVAGTYVLEVEKCSNLGVTCRPGPARGDTAIDVTVVPQCGTQS